jgi:hypothetical protein
MYIYIYLYIYVYIYIYIHIYVYIYVYIYIYMYIYIYHIYHIFICTLLLYVYICIYIYIGNSLRYRGKVIQIIFAERKETNKISKKFKKIYLKKMKFMLRKKSYIGVFQNNGNDSIDIGTYMWLILIYMYICMYTCTFVYINVHLYMHTYIYICIFIWKNYIGEFQINGSDYNDIGIYFMYVCMNIYVCLKCAYMYVIVKE